MAGPPRPAIVRGPGNGPGAAGTAVAVGRGFDLPSLLYTTLAVAFGLFALGRALAVIVLLRSVDTIGMAQVSGALLQLAGVAASAALVFGGCFGPGLPGWARVTMACVAAALMAGTFLP